MPFGKKLGRLKGDFQMWKRKVKDIYQWKKSKRRKRVLLKCWSKSNICRKYQNQCHWLCSNFFFIYLIKKTIALIYTNNHVLEMHRIDGVEAENNGEALPVSNASISRSLPKLDGLTNPGAKTMKA